MSLSQKHAGLILVPWFNSNEWQYVFHCVYSNNREKQLKALDLLKVWKLRTPILSTGVEGTLILLDALLLDTNSIPEEQVSNIFAIALMRFLNRSAANSEKQGSFGKTSTKNELPKWIINLRHDIAHGHQIPSLYNLKMGLDFGFQWLKEKYWEPQSKLIKDYNTKDQSSPDNDFISSLKVCIDLTLGLFENQDLDYGYIEKLKFLNRFKRNVSNPSQKHHIGLDLLVCPEALLKPNFETSEDKNSTEKLDKNFRNIWQELLSVYHQSGLLFHIIEKLFEVVCNIAYPEKCKIMAALWINELFISLKEAGNNIDDILKLEKNQFSYTKESMDFQQNVLNCPSNYSTYFLDSVLKYNKNNESFNEDVINLINAETSAKNLYQGIQEIFTLEDLKVGSLSLEDVNEKENSTFTSIDNTTPIIASKKWQKLNDTSMFRNCPLGMLPHQINRKHPFLALE